MGVFCGVEDVDVEGAWGVVGIVIVAGVVV